MKSKVTSVAALAGSRISDGQQFITHASHLSWILCQDKSLGHLEAQGPFDAGNYVLGRIVDRQNSSSISIYASSIAGTSLETMWTEAMVPIANYGLHDRVNCVSI